MKKLFISVILFFTIIFTYSQAVYEHISNTNIYEFLDELANQQIIEINSVVKPYTRDFIARKLEEAVNKKNLLNNRQKNELDFYLKSFNLELKQKLDYKKKTDIFKKNPLLATALNPLGLFYKDSLFTMSLKPIWGIEYFFNENGNVYHRWGGAETFGYIGKNFGFYANLRDNSESERLVEPEYFTQRQGGPYKDDTTGGDYSEMRGGITYSWKWGSIGLIKDHFVWGSNYNGSNILSGRTPSFAHIKLYLKPVRWFEFNYVHGWLVSGVVDSNRTYNYGSNNREVFHNKYLAANLFTIIPWKNLNVSFGNSIVYSDIGVHPAYLIPFLFYKSVDHTLNDMYSGGETGQNAQMFFDISSRQIKNLHLYLSVFIDEIYLSNMFDKEKSSNWISSKFGFRLSNFPVQNITFTTEYTRTNPITYKHFVTTTTFESNSYNLGHYLRDNAQEIYFSIGAKPIRGLHVNLSYTLAQVGKDYPRTCTQGESTKGLPFLEELIWENQTIAAKVSYEFINNGYVFLNFISSDIIGNVNKFTPEFFHGKTNTISTGFNIGF